MSFEVGYKRPPPDKQFKKGTSGNPKGRPKGAKNLATIIEKELATVITVTENGKRKRMSLAEAIGKRIVHTTSTGDLKALHMMLAIQRQFGHRVEVETESEVPDDFEHLLADYIKRTKHALGEEPPA